jgi:hypothetical protein
MLQINKLECLLHPSQIYVGEAGVWLSELTATIALHFFFITVAAD